MCKSLNLNPLTKPFEYHRLNNKLVLYAKRDCTDQLRKANHISLEVLRREQIGDIYIVTTKAKKQVPFVEGIEDEAIGAVPLLETMGPLERANAMMKAETKSKRRVTLSICGLGMLDETEIEDLDTPPMITEQPAVEKEQYIERAPMWGPHGGKPLTEIPVNDLHEYLRVAREHEKDPARKAVRNTNKKLADAIQKVILEKEGVGAVYLGADAQIHCSAEVVRKPQPNAGAQTRFEKLLDQWHIPGVAEVGTRILQDKFLIETITQLREDQHEAFCNAVVNAAGREGIVLDL